MKGECEKKLVEKIMSNDPYLKRFEESEKIRIWIDDGVGKLNGKVRNREPMGRRAG